MSLTVPPRLPPYRRSIAVGERGREPGGDVCHGAKMDRLWGFGEGSRRFAFHVHSWHYELESWSKCSSLERQIAEPRVYSWSIETRAFVARPLKDYGVLPS